jgi:hypothetical protein
MYTPSREYISCMQKKREKKTKSKKETEKQQKHNERKAPEAAGENGTNRFHKSAQAALEYTCQKKEKGGGDGKKKPKETKIKICEDGDMIECKRT